MAQVKIFGLRKTLRAKRNRVSHAIHKSLSSAFALPAEKCFQRFIFFSEGTSFFQSTERPLTQSSKSIALRGALSKRSEH